jgi:predicted nucleotidyltransferase component of viral defense system
MAAIMSRSNAPESGKLGLVAGALAVDEAFVEKDWYVVQAIAALAALADDELTPVFSGGTSLLKGHGLIKRFSEDIDFKLILSPAFLERSGNQQRKKLRNFRDALSSNWEKAGFKITSVESGSNHGFFKIEMDYPSLLDPHESLRPHILAEVSAKPPRLAVTERPIASFVAQYDASGPELAGIACVDPAETAADKLSALSWRVIVRDRSREDDDPNIVRHIHDLALLDEICASTHGFAALLGDVMEGDRHRGKGAVADLSPTDRLAAMNKKLDDDQLYRAEYTLFVEGMAFAGEQDIPSFDQALAALARVSARLRA